MYPTNNADKEEKDLRWEFMKEKRTQPRKKEKTLFFS